MQKDILQLTVDYTTACNHILIHFDFLKLN